MVRMMRSVKPLNKLYCQQTSWQKGFPMQKQYPLRILMIVLMIVTISIVQTNVTYAAPKPTKT